MVVPPAQELEQPDQLIADAEPDAIGEHDDEVRGSRAQIDPLQGSDEARFLPGQTAIVRFANGKAGKISAAVDIA